MSDRDLELTDNNINNPEINSTPSPAPTLTPTSNLVLSAATSNFSSSSGSSRSRTRERVTRIRTDQRERDFSLSGLKLLRDRAERKSAEDRSNSNSNSNESSPFSYVGRGIDQENENKPRKEKKILLKFELPKSLEKEKDSLKRGRPFTGRADKKGNKEGMSMLNSVALSVTHRPSDTNLLANSTPTPNFSFDTDEDDITGSFSSESREFHLKPILQNNSSSYMQETPSSTSSNKSKKQIRFSEESAVIEGPYFCSDSDSEMTESDNERESRENETDDEEENDENADIDPESIVANDLSNFHL